MSELTKCPMCHSDKLIEGENGLECQDCDWKEEPGELDGLELEDE